MQVYIEEYKIYVECNDCPGGSSIKFNLGDKVVESQIPYTKELLEDGVILSLVVGRFVEETRIDEILNCIWEEERRIAGK